MKRLFFIILIFLMAIYNSPIHALETKIVFGVYYPWYPLYGMQWRDSGGTLHAPTQTGGYVNQDAFLYPFANPIPYLRSGERPTGKADYSALMAWHKANLTAYADQGIDVILVMARPDLPLWPNILSALLEARKLVPNAPQIAFMFDGLEYWEKTSPTTGTLSGPGQDFDVVWEGIRLTLDIAFGDHHYDDELFWYGTKIPAFFYRIEANAGPFMADNYWLNQIRANVLARYNRELYAVLDNYWYGSTYGNGIVTATTSADNYFWWGGALSGMLVSPHAIAFKIASIGPGFDNTKIGGGSVQPRNGGTWYTANWASVVADTAIRWVIVETLNFGEESSQIDNTTAWGLQYLAMTRVQSEAWKGN